MSCLLVLVLLLLTSDFVYYVLLGLPHGEINYIE